MHRPGYASEPPCRQPPHETREAHEDGPFPEEEGTRDAALRRRPFPHRHRYRVGRDHQQLHRAGFQASPDLLLDDGCDLPVAADPPEACRDTLRHRAVHAGNTGWIRCDLLPRHVHPQYRDERPVPSHPHRMHVLAGECVPQICQADGTYRRGRVLRHPRRPSGDFGDVLHGIYLPQPPHHHVVAVRPRHRGDHHRPLPHLPSGQGAPDRCQAGDAQAAGGGGFPQGAQGRVHTPDLAVRPCRGCSAAGHGRGVPAPERAARPQGVRPAGDIQQTLSGGILQFHEFFRGGYSQAVRKHDSACPVPVLRLQVYSLFRQVDVPGHQAPQHHAEFRQDHYQ